MRNAFVIGEFAVALGLLTGAGFLMEAFNELTGADPGYRQEGLLTFSLTASEHRYPEAARMVRFFPSTSVRPNEKGPLP